MFMQRLITSLILIPLVLSALFFGPSWLLISVAILGLLATGWEGGQLIPLPAPFMRVGFLIILLVGLWGCSQLFSYWLPLGIAVWFIIFLAILTFPKSQSYWGYAPIVALTLFILLPLFIQCLVHLYLMPEGKGLILYLLCLVWAADIGAYLAGKRWGQHKLIPQVSPGKSWEGAAGGGLLVLLVAGIGFLYFQPDSIVRWLILAIIIMIISIFGDLFISILKRRCHVKDTGTLIPGHGGILDRLDSIIAALPFFCWGMSHL